MFHVGLPRYLKLNSGRSVSIIVNKTDKTRKHCFRNIHDAGMFPRGKHCFQCQFLFSRCKLCLRYTAGNFNENPSMRAFARILRARASEHLANFCEQFQQRPSFVSTFKLDGTIRYIQWTVLYSFVLNNRGQRVISSHHSFAFKCARRTEPPSN